VLAIQGEHVVYLLVHQCFFKIMVDDFMEFQTKLAHTLLQNTVQEEQLREEEATHHLFTSS
jgi:hypothetical protein